MPRRRKRRTRRKGKSTIKKRINKLLKFTKIPRVFPALAKTIFKTTANLKNQSTVVNGFSSMGSFNLSSLNSVLNTVDHVDDAGAIQTSVSDMESSGHDTFALIYSQYRVNKVDTHINWYGNGTTIVDPICLVIIPAPTTVQPVSTWYGAMNHPLATKTWMKARSAQHRSTKTSISIDCMNFLKKTISRNATDMGAYYDYTVFGAEPTTTTSVHLHLFLCLADATVDQSVSGDTFVGTVTFYQHVTMKKTAADNSTTLMAILAAQTLPEFEA